MIALFLASWASVAAAGEPPTQEFVWEISFMGQRIGERTLEVTYRRAEQGLERVIESTTTIDATEAQFDHEYQMQVAARVYETPASFNTSVNDDGDTWGNELRWGNNGLYLNRIDARGVAEEEQLPATAADLSTIDLFDPLSKVPLTRFESVTVLDAETGETWRSKVRRLGPSEVEIADAELLVEGVVVHPPQGRMAFWYTAEGIPVRYEYYVEGRLFEAKLTELPPPGVDEKPVPMKHPSIQVVDLDAKVTREGAP